MRISFLFLLLLFSLFSCSPDREETTTRGHLRVLVGESVAPVLIPEVNEFMRLYKANGADLSYTIVRSKEANRRFLSDTTRMIITTIPLTDEEKSRVKKTTDEFVEIVLAYEGIVAIVQEGNPVKEMKLEQIRDILDGTVTAWGELYRSKAPRGRIRVILEDSSDVTDYLSTRLLGGRGFRLQPTWTSNSLETVKAISKELLSLGFVSSSWVDSAKARIKMLSLAADSSLADTVFKPARESVGKYYEPHPAYIHLNYYPMKRAVYLYARTTRADFASGFASFLASPAGQKIFLQKGLVPGTQRIILKPSE